MAQRNQYDSDKHDEYVKCPRCSERNAPPESDEFHPECWNCSTHLDIQPVSVGDEVVLTIDDIHQNGSGVGRTEDGFVVLVDGVLPEARVKARIKTVRKNHATAEEIERLELEEDEEDETSEEDEEEQLGRRDNYWGGQ